MTTDVSLSSPFGYGKDAWSSPSLASDFETKAKGKTVETERSVRGDRAEIDGRSNCNLAEICQYGGQAKGDGTQGCSCFAAPDCGSTQKCPLGLGGEPKADGTNDCNCIIYEQMKKGTQTPKAKASGMGTSGGQSGSYKVTWTGGLPPYTCKLTVSGGRTTRKTVQTEENKCSISFSCTTKNSSAKSCSKLRYPYCVGDNTCNYSATVTDSTGSSISFNITAAGNET